MKGVEPMTDRQIDLILQICGEQLEDYLAAELAETILVGITQGINDNMAILEQLGQIE